MAALTDLTLEAHESMIHLGSPYPRPTATLLVLPAVAGLTALWAWIALRAFTWSNLTLGLWIAAAGITSVFLLVQIKRRFETEKDLAQTDLELRKFLDELPMGVAIANGNGRILWANMKGCELLGLPLDAVTTLNWLYPDLLMLTNDGHLMPPDERPLNRVLSTRQKIQDVVVGLEHAEDGRWVWASFTAEPRLDKQGQINQIVLTFEDVTDRHSAITELTIQTFRDKLTSLPNRTLLMERLGQAILRLGRSKLNTAVIFLDLDRFKVINESLGHSAGDQLLVQVAHRLRACMRPEDTVARIGGDDFLVLVEDMHNANDVLKVAERISEIIAPPFHIQNQEVHTTCSMGIAVVNDSDCSAGDMIRDSEVAMYRAKSKGEGSIELFDPSMNAQAMQRFQMEGELRRAIDNSEFILYYQPLVCLHTGRIEGWEALVRWKHPERGMIPPLDFITLAEETGLIVPIGKWVLEEAMRQASIWHKRFPSEAPRLMNVNISARQFQHRDLIKTVMGALESTESEPGWLKLEITESVMMKDPNASLEAMKVFRGLNIHLVIDDFGTGYSSLSYLKRFPVDTLKVDKSFVDGLGTDAESTAIVSAVISLAKSLGMRVTAEGIETQDQLKHLRSLGCDQGQGYFFSRPLPALDAEKLLEQDPKW